METLNYKVLEGTGYNGYILKDAPVKVMQFGEGNFLRAFVDYFYDIANEKAGYNGKVKLVQPIGNFPQMADWINEQEGLYTLYLRGSEKGQKVDAKRAFQPSRPFSTEKSLTRAYGFRNRCFISTRFMHSRWEKDNRRK